MGTLLIPTEADTQALILDWLTALRIKAIRYNTGSQLLNYRNKDGQDKKRMFRAHSAGNGHPDICAYPRIGAPYEPLTDRKLALRTGRLIPVVWWIEVKKIGEEQRPEQRDFEIDYTAIGHYYTLAYSLDDCIRWYRAHA